MPAKVFVPTIPILRRQKARSAAAGIAPARICAVSTEATPRKMNTPSPPPPMAAAMVAVPMVVTVATRIPAMMVRAASGSCTWRRSWPSVMPMATAESQTAGVDAHDSDERVSQDRKQRVQHQRDDHGARADSADEAESESEIRTAPGWGWSARRCDRPSSQRRARRMPRHQNAQRDAQQIAIAMEIPTSDRCSPVRRMMSLVRSERIVFRRLINRHARKARASPLCAR